MPRKHLLLSTSRTRDTGYLEHAAAGVQWLLGGERRRIVFIPYAAVRFSYDDYEEMVAGGLAAYDVEGIHRFEDPLRAVEDADAICVGGGNTFKLVHDLHALGLMDPIREKAMAGAPYLGWSAGANIASPRLCTTNDMPIIEPVSFETLGLIRAQINPHYHDTHPDGHMGETREERIQEFMLLHPKVPVVGLREGAWLQVEDQKATLQGSAGARLFSGDAPPRDLDSGTDLSRYLGPGADDR
jgi:dipeptidase E